MFYGYKDSLKWDFDILYIKNPFQPCHNNCNHPYHFIWTTLPS